MAIDLAGAAGKPDHFGAVGIFKVVYVAPITDGPSFFLAVQIIDDALEVRFDGAGLPGARQASDKQVIAGFIHFQAKANGIMGPLLTDKVVKRG